MNPVNTVRKKVWLCVSLALLGFLVATAFALYSNQRLKEHLTHIRDMDFQLAMLSNELVVKFEDQHRAFEESFLFGVPESALSAVGFSAQLCGIMELILTISEQYPPSRHGPEFNVDTLLNRYNRYAETATEIYPFLAAGREAEDYLPVLQLLAQQQTELSEIFWNLAGHYRAAFYNHLTAEIELAERNNLLFAGFLLGLLVLITLVVNRAANLMLVVPLKRIKESLHAFGRGQRRFPELEKLNKQDEIGELSQAFLNMAAELDRSTVSKAYVDSILRNMSDSLIITARDYRICSLNQAALKLLDYQEKDLLGKVISAIIVVEEAEQEAVAPLEHPCLNKEVYMITREGQRVPVLLSSSAVVDVDDESDLVFVAKDITERKLTEKRLKQMAQFDFLTGLPNRMVFNDRLRLSIHRARREERTMGLMFVDLDRFKGINDTLGHGAGDALLIHLAAQLSRCVRDVDTIARLGGDEFAVILENINTDQDASGTAERLLQQCAIPIVHEDNTLATTASIGIALFPRDATTTSELLRQADMAMYQAKQAGGNRYCFATAGKTPRS